MRKARQWRGVLQDIPCSIARAEHSVRRDSASQARRFCAGAKVRLRSECEQAKTPRGGVFVKRYPKDRKRKERATPRHSATISAGRKRRDAALACAYSAGASPHPTRIAFFSQLLLRPLNARSAIICRRQYHCTECTSFAKGDIMRKAPLLRPRCHPRTQ